jgi:phosphate transport system ATP-binding protein
VPEPGSAVAPLLDVRGVSVWIDDALVVRDASFQLEADNLLAIFGPSGCGKSTLLKTLTGLLRFEAQGRIRTSGEVYFDGTDLLRLAEADLARLRQRIAYIAQAPTVWPTSVYENVALVVRARSSRVAPKAEREIVERTLRLAALWDEVKARLLEPASRLSPGQQQRLSIARALVGNPEVLLLDEPCAFMDPVSSLRIEDMLHDLQTSVHGMLIVTHNMQQAARMSSSSLYMSMEEVRDRYTGFLVEHAPTSKMFTRPDDERTEGFLTGRF